MAADPACRPFPSDDDCRDDKAFCSLWRTSGFLLSFATIVELATLVSFLVVLAGGKFKREGGWRLIGGLLLADAVVEFAGMGIVVSFACLCLYLPTYLPTSPPTVYLYVDRMELVGQCGDNSGLGGGRLVYLAS